MGKTSEKVTKDPKRQERGKKSRETYMKRLKEKILNDKQLSTSSSTDNSMPSTFVLTDRSTPSTSSSIVGPSDTYIYGVGILAVLAIGDCLFFVYNTSHAANEKQVHEKQQQPPKRRNML